MSRQLISSSLPVKPTSTRLLIVIVVYERGLDKVQAWPFVRQRLICSGKNIVVSNEDDFFSLDQILIYDNSPQSRARPEEHIQRCAYIHDANNGGTAAAYGRARDMAIDAGIDWLLLLDQDTLLPTNFFVAACSALVSSRQIPCAMLPWVYHGSKIISPAQINAIGTIVPLHDKSQIPSSCLTAIASGSFLYVPAVSALGPFPRELWLDYVDHWIFLRLHACGAPMILFNTLLQHDLSVCNVESLSKRRLMSILDGELIFTTMLGIRARFFYPLRLLFRISRYVWKKPQLAIHMIAWVTHRIFGIR